MNATVLSPHPFTRAPSPGTAVASWDRLTTAWDPVARMRERRDEDRRALTLVGGEPPTSISSTIARFLPPDGGVVQDSFVISGPRNR